MANTTLTADIIAKEAVMILDNNLKMANAVFRGYENEFDKNVNGYKIGDTISIRKPTDFTVRTGATATAQDVNEGKVVMTVNIRKGIDFKFTSQDLTLKIGELSDRVIKPAMVQLANDVDSTLFGLYSKIPQWVGTAGQTINSFSDYMLGPQQLDSFAVPASERTSMLSVADYYGLMGSQTGLYMQNVAKEAYREGNVGMLAGVDTNMAQNVANHTCGTRTGSTAAIGAAITTSTTTYDAVKNTNNGLTQQTISVSQLGGATVTVKAGDVFTISNVWAVNPVTKARLPFLKQFVVVSDATAATAAITNLVISPAMIWTGAFKNVDVAVSDLANSVVTWVGAAGAVHPQNLVFHKNAFALVSVPLESPPGATDVSRQTYKGTSVRVIPVYDGITDESLWRLDILYAAAVIDHRLATRLSGT